MLGEPHVDGRVLRARAQRVERRGQILEAARKVFAEKGYHGGSIADIIETAGIARGTFYLHFEGKRAVFGEVLERLLEELRGAITRVDVKGERSPYDQLVDNVERVLDVLVANADVTRILLRSGGEHDEELGQKVSEFYDHALEMITGSLALGRELGMVGELDVQLAASCALGSIKETVDHLVLRRPEGARKKARPLDRRAIAKKLLDYNLFGVLTRA
ncbi:TetR/AcrR family transcriptional regulator [Myxococcota bacterium]|nr:TetR/AcrR family transcriptional regulator [Myxococcota bacterium]